MSHTPTKKSVFDRIGAIGGMSTPSSSSSSAASTSVTTNVTNKSTHGFCNAYVKTGTCPLGDTCKYIHEQPNVEKQSGSKDEFRITKTITRVVDMSSPPIKSTVTVSNEQRPVVVSNTIQSTRTVVESVNTTSSDHSDRRLSGSSDRKQSQTRTSESKSKSSPKKKTQSSSSYENRHSSNKKTRSMDSDSPVSSASESDYTHKHKKKSDSHSTSSKHKKHESLSPTRNDDEETLNDQLIRQSQTYNKSPKRTIVITERKKDENIKQSKSKSNPDIEFLGSKRTNRDKKSIETIHQQAENTKKSMEVKREKKSPSKSSSSSDQQRRHSSSTNINEKNISIKTEDSKHQLTKYERSDRTALQSTPPIVHLSPTSEQGSVTISNVPEKTTNVQPPSPICVILDDDSSPSPSIEKKIVRQTSEKKTNENEKNDSKQNKRVRDSDKGHNKEKTNEHNNETKRKRLNDGSSRQVISSSKSGNDNRSTNNRSDARRSGNTSSRDESSSRKYKEKSESKTDRNNGSKDRNSTAPSSKSRSNNNDRRDTTTRSSPDKKRSTHRRGKEKGLENVTDSEEHLDEPILPKQTALEAYMSMDWSLLSRDKRIPLNTQVTSRIVNNNNNNSIGICERLLTNEQKEKLNGLESQSFPLTDFLKQLQIKSTSQIVNSCNRRFGSSAKDMIDMRHKWFTKFIEPVQQYEFINKEHYMAYQQAINSLLDKTSNDVPTVQIETTTADILLS